MSTTTLQTHLQNRLTRALGGICREHPLAEKWLLAPSNRAGRQWLERVAAGGTPVVNARVMTLSSLAMRLAAPALLRRNLKLTPVAAGPIFIDRIAAELAGSGRAGYILAEEPGPGLAAAMHATIRDLRLAGVRPDELDGGRFEVAAKGKEIRALLAGWEELLRRRGEVDGAAVLDIARQELASGARALPEGGLVLVPADLQLRALESALIAAFPKDRVRELPVDERAAGPAAPATGFDAATDMAIFRAAGEVNEVQRVLRTCLAEKVPLDHVEIVHTSGDTYLPLIFETFAALAEEASGYELDLPVTFAEGVPARFMRPGRALAAWIDWIRDDFPQKALAAMIREGLVVLPQMDSDAAARARLAAILATVPIGLKRERYLPRLEEALAVAERLAGAAGGGDGDDDDDDHDDGDGDGGDHHGGKGGPRRRAARDARHLRALIDATRRLLDTVPEAGASQAAVLDKAAAFLTTCARAVSRFDRNARNELVRVIDTTRGCLAEQDSSSLDVWEWLADLPGSVRVEGSAPQPGRVHVSPLGAGGSGGGHSGRPWTFVIGLDDGRYPGAGRQDPLLLDNERSRVSPALPTADERLSRKAAELERLLARVRGRVRLGYSCRDLIEDRELFPSPAALAAFRAVSGRREAGRTELEASIDPPASFAPGGAHEALDAGGWWLWRLCRAGNVRDAEQLVREKFPHLARGAEAAAARAGEAFTEWDGHVPLAGTRHDPLSPGGPVMSASGLERLGDCPRGYFYQRVLGIEPPGDLELDPARWLDPAAMGSLLHEVLHRFMSELIAEDALPVSAARDFGRLDRLLKAAVRRYADFHPVINDSGYAAQVRELGRAARIFLAREEQDGIESRAVFLEASIGMSSNCGGSPLDTDQPVSISVGKGRAFRARGRIDRIDRIVNAPGDSFALWDYKSGGTWKYDDIKVFGGGRVLQHALYTELAGARLREVVGPGARVATSGYFFPGARGRGERRAWPPEKLADWHAVAAALCGIIAKGAFVTRENDQGCTYCDYQGACGPAKGCGGRKLEHAANEALAPLRELREYE